MDFSPEYYAALAKSKAVHESGRYYTGHFIQRHIPRVKAVIDELGCKNVLDYGCGRNADKLDPLPSKEWGVPVSWYDPAVPRFSQRPSGKSDLVVMCQVLSAVPTQDREAVIRDVYAHARKAVFLIERGVHIKKKKRAAGVQYDVWIAQQFVALLEANLPKKVEAFLCFSPPHGGIVLYRVNKDGTSWG